MIAIHQSQFLPWVPYFYKILKSDTFIVLNDVQFRKNWVQNRNKIKTPSGPIWLTLPVSLSFGTPINEVRVSNVNVYKKLLKTINANYKKSTYYNQIYPLLESIFEKKYQYLDEVNLELLTKFLEVINGKKFNIITSGEIETTQKKEDLVIELIKSQGEKEYLSGKGALNYMNLSKFKKQDIKVYTYDFVYSEYPQLWNKMQGFIPDLSILDLLFNNLANAKCYILGNGSIYEVI